MSDDRDDAGGDARARPPSPADAPAAVFDEAFTLYRAGRLELEALCRLMIRFGATPAAATAPRATLAALLAKTASATVPEHVAPAASASEPRQTRPLRTRATPSTATTTTSAGTRLHRFTAARGVVPTVHPGLDADSPDPAGPGDERHALGRELGEGGMGRVRVAVDRDLRRPVAVKVLKEEHRNDPVLLQAFLEEAIITGGLEHPNIVAVHEVGVSPELGPYYTMKRLDGEPLSELLSRLRRGDPEATAELRLGRLVEIFAQTLRAVAYAHDHGVIHCDLKPANILVGAYGDVTVVDWGLAKVVGEAGRQQARAQLWSGSPGYMAPEQATSQDIDDIDRHSDIWSLGAILYEILTLQLPFADPDGALPDGVAWRAIPFPSERQSGRHVPGELERLCMAALEKDPAGRPARVQSMLRDVEEWLHGTRERERQKEAAAEMLSEAAEALHAARVDEQAIDRLQHAADAGGTDAAAREELDHARARLVGAYEAACEAVLNGLELNPEGAGLHRAAAALYWYTFERLYPGRIAADPEIRRRALELLERLARVSLTAIMRRGQTKGVPLDAAHDALARRLAGIDDPWLAAAARIGARVGDNPAVDEVVERIAALHDVDVFAGTPGHELLAVAEACDRVACAAGSLVFATGDPGDALYIVLSGRIAIARDGKVLATLGPREAFGEVALIDGSTRTADARCEADATLLVLTAERFRQIIVGDGTIGLRVMRVLATRLRHATEREAGLA
ncbi:MAG: protein kinase [Deltaproteobacteria bacterium]|nr:protein kinase [Deltaproteobacteria bacterium]